ncbi:MAG: bacillithiol system redox-active protein YtxJ [Acidobacteriota bacterium]|nr:bacillithiol system redox-active protein YtxJ [Acidobacteriota bacterium]
MSPSQLHQLASIEELDELLEQSRQRAQLIFKHSLTCPISATAYRHFQSYLDHSPASDVDYHLVTVQQARGVSNEAANRLSVRHESPQAILVRNQEAVWDASHGAITEQSLQENLSQN